MNPCSSTNVDFLSLKDENAIMYELWHCDTPRLFRRKMDAFRFVSKQRRDGKATADEFQLFRVIVDVADVKDAEGGHYVDLIPKSWKG
jgi:hypothetical protein